MSVRKEVLAEGVEVYCGDCLEVLNDTERGPFRADLVSATPHHPDSVSPRVHVIGDPPYEDELHKAMGRIRRNDGRAMVQDLGFEGVNAERTAIAATCVKASTGWLILFTLAEGVRAWRDDVQLAGGKWDTTLAWIKPDASPRFNGQGAARGFENAITAWCGTGYRSWNGGGKRGVYTHLVNYLRQGEHPTEKPVSLMAEIILDFTNPGETICDPFCGSGSTGVAAVRCGRGFIGIERDPKWFDLSCRRISEALKQPDFFNERPKAPEQLSILDSEAAFDRAVAKGMFSGLVSKSEDVA